MRSLRQILGVSQPVRKLEQRVSKERQQVTQVTRPYKAIWKLLHADRRKLAFSLDHEGFIIYRTQRNEATLSPNKLK